MAIIYDTRKTIFEISDLRTYWSSGLVNELYFKPKKINKTLIDEQLKSHKYLKKFSNTINLYKDKDVERIISKKMDSFELDTLYRLNDYKIYVIIGLDTTSIYSVRYNDDDVVVLLLESTDGNLDNLNILLAHEFTHLVRRQLFNRDIFEASIGERLVVEGIGCNYSRDIVPGKEDHEYCIVDKDVVEWTKNNFDKIEARMDGKMTTNELMKDYFYMFADTEKTGLPARTGYVYGYLKVKEYLKKNHLKTKEILNKNWEDILGY